MAIRRDHSGGAVTALLQTTMNVVGPDTITLDTTTGWPDADVGPFVIVIDRGEPTEEKVLVAGISGLDLTVDVSGRGYDNTVASAHNAGATVEHTFSGVEADEANAHVMSDVGVHGLGSLDPVIGQSHLDAHAAESDGVHGAPPGDPLATEEYVKSIVSQAFLVGEVKHVAVNPEIDEPAAVWLLCDGRVLDATVYPDLAGVLGSTFGGDGTTTFGLPNLLDKVVRGSGTFGTSGGSDTVTLTAGQVPAHTHTIDHNHAAVESGNAKSPVNVRMGDNIEPEADKVGDSGDVWTNNNSTRVASAGGAGGTTATSDAYSANHSHTVNLPEYQGVSGSTGNGDPVTVIPSHIGFLPVIYAGTVVI